MLVLMTGIIGFIMIVDVAFSTLEIVIVVILISVTHIQYRVLAHDFFPLIFVLLIILDHLVMPLYPL